MFFEKMPTTYIISQCVCSNISCLNASPPALHNIKAFVETNSQHHSYCLCLPP